jgi:hypothetical protein
MVYEFGRNRSRHLPEGTEENQEIPVRAAGVRSRFEPSTFRIQVGGGLEIGLSERVLRLLTIELTLDQTLGNWYHFIKPIRRIQNLLSVK